MYSFVRDVDFSISMAATRPLRSAREQALRDDVTKRLRDAIAEDVLLVLREKRR